jgi:dTDP-4-dehydrorhamnose 3,5-epimerase
LTEDCELIYHHSQFYTPGAEGGIKFDDPAINTNWPLPATSISERDNQHPLLDENFKGL